MRHSNLVNLRPVLLGLSFATLLWMVVPTSSFAEDSFGTAVPSQTLTKLRGGDASTTDSNNNILTSNSTQNTTATNQNNSITAGGDVIAGNVNVSNDAFTDVHGMTNVVINTGPMANVQGIMSLNLTLQ